MAEIIKTYRQSVGAMRFIGKKYGDGDRVNGMFGAKWGEWFQNGWFDVIERQFGGGGNSGGGNGGNGGNGGGMKDIYEDGDAYIGLMRGGDGRPFEYWIGCFMPVNTAVPDGFGHIDFPKSELGVCWLYGKEGDVYFNEAQCMDRLKKDGIEVKGEWCLERYGCPRFTTPDEKGNIILDICFYL